MARSGRRPRLPARMAPVRRTAEQLIGIRNSEAYASGELIPEAAGVAFEHVGTLRQSNHKMVPRRVLEQIYQSVQQRANETIMATFEFQELPMVYEGLVRAFEDVKAVQTIQEVAS